MIFRRAFRDSIPVMMGYLTMGFAAGMLLVVGGGISFAPVWAFLTGTFFVSGVLQYILVDWVATSLALGSVLLVTFCVNFRYSVYALSLIPRYQDAMWWQRLYMMGTIADETYALQMACDLNGRARGNYCFYLALLDHLYWIVGVTSGAVAGVVAEEVFSPARVAQATQGIDFTMTALFLVILTDLLRAAANRVPALLGFLCALPASMLLGKSGMLLPSIALILVLLFVLRRWIDVR